MNNKLYVCDSCGAEFVKWAGKCSQCGEWNSLKEIIVGVSPGGRKRAQASKTTKLSKIKEGEIRTIKSGISEFDLVLGEGIVTGSIILVGGEPGIGKSTLLLQALDKIAKERRIIYVSGEESFAQIKSRADRLKIKNDMELLSETDVEKIIATARKVKPALLVVDSIQSVMDANVNSGSGSISQVKACGLALQRFAKNSGVSVVIIGHVTKTGVVAGPKTLEHLVDTVVYLEGDRYNIFRILRCSKNRFGSVNEVGIFEMTSRGLAEVKKASSELISQRSSKREGSAITAIIEGTRPFLIEIQALATKSYMGFPQRKASGFDYNRMQLLLKDPSCDLAAAMAVVSAVKKKPIKKDLAIIGEVGLSGDVRSVPFMVKRIKEIKSLGFKKIIIPHVSGKILTTKDKSVKIIEVRNIKEAIGKSLA